MDEYYISLCKDENDYLDEWISYHKNIGIEHFYIYDHNSKIPLSDTLKKYIDEGLVDVIKWTQMGIGTQPMAYADCVMKYRDKNRWIGFIDTDEFLVIKKPYNNIKEFMQPFEDFGGVGLNWLMFGSSNLETQPDGVLENFILSSKEDYDENKHIKTIANPKLIMGFPTPHNVILSSNIIVNENFSPIINTPFSKQSYNKAQINHYYTRSREEFIRKMNRGRGDQAGRREMSEFNQKQKVLNEVNQKNNLNDWLRFYER